MKKSKKIFSEILSYVIVIGIVVLIKIYVASPIKVNGNSMYDTLMDKDIMILNEFTYYFNEVERLDIVVVDEGGELLIKRVIGLPGDEIYCKDGEVIINGMKLIETYTSSTTEDFEMVKLGEDEYFIMGDNRDASVDSRMYGPYKRSQIKGKASLTVYPFDRFGFKE